MATPWHLWVIGILALVWNTVGALDYYMTVSQADWYRARFTLDQLAYFDAFPGWTMAAWAIAVWGALLGSVLLLFRSGHAVLIFALSLLGIAGTSLYSFVLSETPYSDVASQASIWLSLAIGVVAVLLFLYARAMRKIAVLG